MKPALIIVEHWDVYFQKVIGTLDGYALDSTAPRLFLGSVEQSARVVDGLTQRCWEATDADGRKFVDRNKTLVIERMIEGNGITRVELVETIPPLF